MIDIGLRVVEVTAGRRVIPRTAPTISEANMMFPTGTTSGKKIDAGLMIDASIEIDVVSIISSSVGPSCPARGRGSVPSGKEPRLRRAG